MMTVKNFKMVADVFYVAEVKRSCVKYYFDTEHQVTRMIDSKWDNKTIINVTTYERANHDVVMVAVVK